MIVGGAVVSAYGAALVINNSPVFCRWWFFDAGAPSAGVIWTIFVLPIGLFLVASGWELARGHND